jgi:hypothetical protein
MWQKDNNGYEVTWQDALKYCNNLSLGGYDDWHLPTLWEVWQMFDYETSTCYSGFNGCNLLYLSSTSIPWYLGAVYYMDPNNGAIGYASKGDYGNHTARCVRLESVSYSNAMPTSQTSCWDDEGFEAISCSDSNYPGQDANIYGAAYARVLVDNGNGTLSDLNGGLMWQQENVTSGVTWQGALDYCNNLSLGGYSDWHLPAFGEVWQMFDYQTGICYSGFIGCDDFWSSTSVPSVPTAAYYVSSNGGYIAYGSKGNEGIYSARCVRFEN